MNIRKAEEKDIKILSEKDMHICETELQNLIHLKRIYISEQEHQFMGWLRYGLFWDNTPFMNMLYLLEDFRGKGYGKALVNYWEMEMKQSGYDVVMTSTVSDEYAQHFYHKLGYKTVGGFTPHDSPYEILLEKEL